MAKTENFDEIFASNQAKDQLSIVNVVAQLLGKRKRNDVEANPENQLDPYYREDPDAVSKRLAEQRENRQGALEASPEIAKSATQQIAGEELSAKEVRSI